MNASRGCGERSDVCSANVFRVQATTFSRRHHQQMTTPRYAGPLPSEALTRLLEAVSAAENALKQYQEWTRVAVYSDPPVYCEASNSFGEAHGSLVDMRRALTRVGEVSGPMDCLVEALEKLEEITQGVAIEEIINLTAPREP